MYKHLLKIPFFLIIIVLFFIQLNKIYNNEIKTNTTPTPVTTEVKNVGNLPEAKTKLIATEIKGNLGAYYTEYLTNFYITIDGKTQNFPYWVNVSNKTWYPFIYFDNINQDKKNEIIIILTTGQGSELLEQEAHVFNKVKTNIGELYEERLVENPMSIINKNVKTKLTKSDAIIKIGNKITKINIKKFGIEQTHLFPDVSLGNILRFKVINNKLKAVVGATISPSGGYLGNIYITYTFKDNMYQADDIKFVEESFQ